MVEKGIASSSTSSSSSTLSNVPPSVILAPLSPLLIHLKASFNVAKIELILEDLEKLNKIFIDFEHFLEDQKEERHPIPFRRMLEMIKRLLGTSPSATHVGIQTQVVTLLARLLIHRNRFIDSSSSEGSKDPTGRTATVEYREGEGTNEDFDVLKFVLSSMFFGPLLENMKRLCKEMPFQKEMNAVLCELCSSQALDPELPRSPLGSLAFLSSLRDVMLGKNKNSSSSSAFSLTSLSLFVYFFLLSFLLLSSCSPSSSLLPPKAHLDNADIQYQMASIITSLTDSAQSLRILLANGGVLSHLQTLMRNFKSDSQLQEMVLSALQNLVSPRPELLDEVGETKGAEGAEGAEGGRTGGENEEGGVNEEGLEGELEDYDEEPEEEEEEYDEEEVEEEDGDEYGDQEGGNQGAGIGAPGFPNDSDDEEEEEEEDDNEEGDPSYWRWADEPEPFVQEDKPISHEAIGMGRLLFLVFSKLHLHYIQFHSNKLLPPLPSFMSSLSSFSHFFNIFLAKLFFLFSILSFHLLTSYSSNSLVYLFRVGALCRNQRSIEGTRKR
jgi:hypothetical protein